jgi:hypothetical protein
MISSQTEKIEQIKVLDLNGKELQVVLTNSTITTIDLSEYTAGIYLIAIKTLNGSSNIQRVVKQ